MPRITLAEISPKLSKITTESISDSELIWEVTIICRIYIVLFIIIPSGSKHPHFMTHSNRLRHNSSQLGSLSSIYKERLAEAGLVAASEEGVVECFVCGMQFRQWKEDDDPAEHHAALSPDCLYMQTVFGKDFILSCRIKFTRHEPMEVDDDRPFDAFILNLLTSIKRFISSSQMAVAREFDYCDDWIIALFVRKQLRTKEGYRNAGDLVNDLEDLTYSGTVREGPTENAIYVIKNSCKTLEIAFDKWSRLISATETSRNHNKTVQQNRPQPSIIHEPLQAAPVAAMQRDPDVEPAMQAANANVSAHTQLHEETAMLYYSTRCKRCLRRPANHVILPCSELTICTECLKSAVQCPSCKGPIIDTIQTFM